MAMDDEEKVGLGSEVSDATAHQISHDPWYQVGFVLTTGINSAYVLGYSGSIMVPLGWYGGVIGLIMAAAISLYANSLLARLHEIGGKRHIRYRDLAGHVYGRKVYSLTWVLQYINLFMISIGCIILAGRALKATVKPPVVKNMVKALWFQFTIGVLPLFAVTFMGYWAYGSSTSSYILNSVSGPVWVKMVANVAAFLQTVISLHIFASPMYEYLDTKFGRGKGNPFSFYNLFIQSDGQRRVPHSEHSGGCSTTVPWRLHEFNWCIEHIPSHICSCKSYVPGDKEEQALSASEMLAPVERCRLQLHVCSGSNCCSKTHPGGCRYISSLC